MALTHQLPRSLPIIPASIASNVSLADKNWFKTGGAAQWYCEPTQPEQFQEALAFAATHELPLCILGEGANVLISDEGFNGLLLRPLLKDIKRTPYDETHDFVEAQAGVRFADLINWCLEHNLTGLEEFSGIPGTVGGSVFINIHYFEFLLSQFLVSAQVIEKSTGTIKTVDNSWFSFGYDYSTLHEDTHYLVSARFKLKRVDTATAMFAKGRSIEMIRHRAKRYPTQNTCGSFFRNFFDHEVASTSKKLIFVAYYLDKLGIKGELTVGDAIISHQHANMIVNRGNATTQDIITLARMMQDKVYENFGILPQPECRLIGFSQHPLRL